jgi:hypothetical protein
VGKKQMMTGNDSQTIETLQKVITILTTSINKLDGYDYASASIMTGVARQMLSEAQANLEQHLEFEKSLKNILQR